MFDYEDDTYNRIEFSYRDKLDGVRKTVEVSLENKESYTDIVQEFVFFLQAIGYTYIAGITVHDAEGEDMHTTDF